MHDVGQVVEEECCSVGGKSGSCDAKDACLHTVCGPADVEDVLLHCSILVVANRVGEESERLGSSLASVGLQALDGHLTTFAISQH